MDFRLRAAIDEAISGLNRYMDAAPDLKSPHGRAEYFHLIQAKQAMMKAILCTDSSNFSARRLVKEYERILVELSKPDTKPS